MISEIKCVAMFNINYLMQQGYPNMETYYTWVYPNWIIFLSDIKCSKWHNEFLTPAAFSKDWFVFSILLLLLFWVCYPSYGSAHSSTVVSSSHVLGCKHVPYLLVSLCVMHRGTGHAHIIVLEDLCVWGDTGMYCRYEQMWKDERYSLSSPRSTCGICTFGAASDDILGLLFLSSVCANLWDCCSLLFISLQQWYSVIMIEFRG